MMKVAMIFLAILSFIPMARADVVTLNNTETLAVPTSPKLEWEITRINASKKILQVSYRWLDATSKPIQKADSHETLRIWTCRDVPAQALSCVGPGDPYVCCTAAGTGPTCTPADTCFTDVFGFTIRSQDVGTKIGVGLRTLIWNKFRTSVLTGGNNGAFDTN